MKISKYIFLPVAISIILFLIPFFWLKSGEMDLGGDSSRLYFYDPASYLFKAALYVVSPSSFGAEYLGYYNIPFIFLLLILKSIIVSPTILISMFYGLNLSIPFIACYLIIKELIGEKKGWYETAIVGGLLYVFFPAVMDGWKHVLITYNHILLSPLIFYLLLKYFKTSNIKYILVTILLTFIFSPNFSVGAAPSIFAFYPLSIVFLMLYTKLILKRHIIVKHIVLGFLLFVGIQAFHLFPTINSIFSSGNDLNSTIFTDKGKFDRGLSYFSAIAPNIKASLSLFGLPQMKSLSLFPKVFIVFPLVIVIAFLFKKNKTILLTAGFFLIVLFFTTANITNTWVSIYTGFFLIPGFSMFRNFNSQWIYTYLFFYSILFGQALYIVINKLNKIYAYVFTFFVIAILTINAVPLIKGDIANEILWQSRNVPSVIQIDPDYEKALSHVRLLPADAKVLTLPLTDPGYQIIGGKNGGAYMGPSTISYLAGKKDFAGYDELLGYKELVLRLIRDKEYEELKKLLGFLNIKYIFYDADPLVYEKFPSFPYQHVRTILPKDQKSYKQFINKLHLKEVKNINNKFFVFELQNNYYLPQINIAKKSIHFNKPFTEINVPLSIDGQDSRIAVDNNYKPIPKNYPIKFDETLNDIQGKNSFLDFFVNADASVGFPYAFSAWPTDSLVYPFVVLREDLRLSKPKKVDDIYIETAILIADKRIGELERWGRDVPVLGNVKSIDALDKSWREPSMWEAFVKRNKYNAWEIGFLRYQRKIYDLINKIEKPNDSLYSSTANKEKLKKAVIADRERFYTIIEENIKLSEEKKIYLLKLSIKMFDSIVSRLQSKIPSPEEIPYDLSDLEEGEYQVFIDKKSVERVDQSKWQIVINGRKLYLRDFQQDGNWYKGQNITVKDARNNILTLLSTQSVNLLSEDQWRLFEEKGLGKNYASLSIEDGNLPNSNGLVKTVSDWSPESYYILYLEYLTHGKSFKVIAYDKSLQKDSNLRKIFEADLRSSEWRHYEAIFLSSNDANLASLQILKSEGGLMDAIWSKEKSSKIEIRNLSIIRVSNPKIVLKKIIKPDNQNESFTKITFTRINSTKYQIDVKNATSPYTLLFTEAFHSEWRLVDLDPRTNTSSVRGYLSRFFAAIGNTIGSVLRIGETKGDGTISYFGGDVKENYSKNIFLDNRTFNAWGKNEVAHGGHFGVNGYSNAWYIKPEDVGGKIEYSLILEMGTQKLFYRSLVLSILVAILCMIFLIVRLLKHIPNEK